MFQCELSPTVDRYLLTLLGKQCVFQAADLQLLDIGLQGSVLILKLIPVALRGALPLDVIFGLLLYQPDALQHICDVVDPAFLHLHQNDSNDPSMP